MQVAKGSLFRSRVKDPEQSAKCTPWAEAACRGPSCLTLPHPHLTCLYHLHPTDQFLISLDGLWSLDGTPGNWVCETGPSWTVAPRMTT